MNISFKGSSKQKLEQPAEIVHNPRGFIGSSVKQQIHALIVQPIGTRMRIVAHIYPNSTDKEFRFKDKFVFGIDTRQEPLYEDEAARPVYLYTIRTMAPGLVNVDIESSYDEQGRILPAKITPQNVSVIYELATIGFADKVETELRNYWKDQDKDKVDSAIQKLRLYIETRSKEIAVDAPRQSWVTSIRNLPSDIADEILHQGIMEAIIRAANRAEQQIPIWMSALAFGGIPIGIVLGIVIGHYAGI